jgi:ABC-type arginine transport system permease subunit
MPPARARLHFAIGAFVSEEVTLGQAAEMAGVSQTELMSVLILPRISRTSLSCPRNQIMVIISDTSPLTALLLLGRGDLLTSLFERVVIPPAVERELLCAHASLP